MTFTESQSPNSNGTAPGCTRFTLDLPTDLGDMLRAEAARPPKIPAQEYIRRVIAGHFGYPLPSWAQRRKKRLTISGAKRKRPGPKPGPPKGGFSE